MHVLQHKVSINFIDFKNVFISSFSSLDTDSRTPVMYNIFMCRSAMLVVDSGMTISPNIVLWCLAVIFPFSYFSNTS